MLDPLAAAVGVGLLGPVVAGPLIAYALDAVPDRWRRTTEWALIAGSVVFAIAADALADGPVTGAPVYLLAALPGLITFLVWRSLIASALVSLAPMYFVIGILTRGLPPHTPATALDRAIPLRPAWMLVYGSLYVFVVILPLLVVRQRDLIRRAMQAYLTVMLAGYVGFLLYPTAAPRPAVVDGSGFAVWTLRIMYSIDVPYNCFPSLHVAYSFVAALSCSRMHRRLGIVAIVWAWLIAVSTLYTKQHYVVDVIAGTLLAYAASGLFLRQYPRDAVAERDRLAAPWRALIAAGFFAAMVAALWIAYQLRPGIV